MSFITPILEYGDNIWDNCSERDAALLEDVQITAARINTGIRVNSRTILYNELGWNTLCVRRKVHKLILFQDLLKPCFPPQTSYPLRNQDGPPFSIPQARTSSYMNSYRPSTIKLWNNLPLHIRNL